MKGTLFLVRDIILMSMNTWSGLKFDQKKNTYKFGWPKWYRCEVDFEEMLNTEGITKLITEDSKARLGLIRKFMAKTEAEYEQGLAANPNWIHVTGLPNEYMAEKWASLKTTRAVNHDQQSFTAVFESHEFTWTVRIDSAGEANFKEYLPTQRLNRKLETMACSSFVNDTKYRIYVSKARSLETIASFELPAMTLENKNVTIVGSKVVLVPQLVKQKVIWARAFLSGEQAGETKVQPFDEL